MPEGSPTLKDLSSAHTTPAAEKPLTFAETKDVFVDVPNPPLPTLAPDRPRGLPADCEAVWVNILDKETGQRSRQPSATCARCSGLVNFVAGQAVVPARATITYEGGGAAKPRARFLVDELRDDFGYEIVPIPPGTPLLPTDDLAKWEGALR